MVKIYHLLFTAFFVIMIRLAPCRTTTQRTFDKVRLDKEGFDKVQTIHYNWYLHSIKAIMGQLGKDLLPKLDKSSRRQFLRCLNAITDKKDLVGAARCLVEAKEGYEDMKVKYANKKGSFSLEKLPAIDGNHGSKDVIKSPFTLFRRRRLLYIHEPSLPEILSSSVTNPPRLLMLPKKNRKRKYKKFLRKNYKKRLEKAEEKLRRYRSRRAKRSPHRLVIDKISKSDSNGFQVVKMDRAPSLLPRTEKSAVRRLARLVRAAVRPAEESAYPKKKSKWNESYESLLKIKKALDEKAKQPGARVYDFRMFDLVIGNSKPTKAKKEKSIAPPFVQQAYNLIRSFEGKSKEFGDSANIKFLSPRFAPIMPDKADIKGHLSPSIFSFYKDETEEQLLPLPKLLDATGMTEEDRGEVLETVMEVTGARQIVDDAMKTLSSTELFGMQGEIKEVTERIAKIFTNLEKSFNRKQKKDMDKRGFTFLEANQLEELHREQGLAKHASEIDFDIHEYGNQTHTQREESLWLRVAEIASNGTKTRSKRQITWPTLLSVNKPTVLSPYMFTPIYGLVVLGPCVLSPSLFSPLLLNPAVLSPYVLSPAVGMPFILSPYLLSPYVLSPLVMAPFILNPYVLSPNVINPYVLSPLILSPLVLCPDIISPMVLGGSILSPGVLSPSVLSKSYLMVSILSPSLLS